MITTPHWPAVIRRFGELELTVVSDEAEWTGDADLSRWPYGPADELIDSDGVVFYFSYVSGVVTFGSTGRVVNPQMLQNVVRQHLLAMGRSSSEYDRLCSGVSESQLAAVSIQYLDRVR